MDLHIHHFLTLYVFFYELSETLLSYVLQNLFLYGYGAIFNLIAIIITTAFQGLEHL
jgi:hypothetical protein